MDDTLMQFVIIITILLGLAILVNAIRQRFFANRPAVPPEELDLLNNPISRAHPGETRDPDEKTIPIYKLSNIAEANTLKSLLEENGINCMIHSFYDLAYDGLWQEQKGWGVLKVLEKDQDKANDLIDAFLEAKDQKSEPMTDDMAQATPLPAGRPVLSNAIFTASLVILLAGVAVIIVAIFSAYRDSGRKLAEEGYNHSINNEYDKAIEYYNKAISHWYRESWVYNNRGYARHRKGDLDNAIKDYDKAIKLDPKDALAYGNRSGAKYDKGDYAGSLMDCEQAIKINPGDAMAWDNKGYALGELGRHEEALEAFDKSIKLNPKSVYAWEGKGYTLSKLGRYEESLKVLDKAIELDPKFIGAWDNKAYVLGKLGKYEESFKAFDTAIAINPKNAVIWYNRACVYSFKNDKQNVFADLKKAMSLEAKFKAEAHKDEDFKWLWNDEEFKKLTK